MTNQVLQLFASFITNKCYINKYGRLALFVKHVILSSEGKIIYKRFPVDLHIPDYVYEVVTPCADQYVADEEE